MLFTPRAVVLCAASLALAACGASSVTPAIGASESIGPSGGVVTIDSGPATGASVGIPTLALVGNVVVTATAAGAPTDLPYGVHAVGPAVVFGPEGETFLVPVTITLPTTAAASAMLTRPASGGAWTTVDGTTAAYDGRSIVGQVAHFSVFVPVSTDAVDAAVGTIDSGWIADAGPIGSEPPLPPPIDVYVPDDAPLSVDVAVPNDAVAYDDAGFGDCITLREAGVPNWPTGDGYVCAASATPADLAAIATAASSAQCSGSPSGVITPTSDMNFVSLSLGVWLQCCSMSAVGPDTNIIGFELDGDCSWYKLYRDPSTGELTRSAPLPWMLVSQQLDLEVPVEGGYGTQILHPVFFSSPNQAYFINEGVYDSMYMRAQ